MKPEDIRKIQPSKSGADHYGGWNHTQTDALLFIGVMVQELAAQFSALNEHLTAVDECVFGAKK